MKIKLFSATALILLLVVNNVFGLNITVTNDTKDILDTRKIGILFTLDPETQAVLCSTINFSIDNPNVTILEWHCPNRPINQFLPNFKRSKKIFSESFNCDLKIKIKLSSKTDIASPKIFNGTTIYASCIAIKKNGQSKPINLCCAIDENTKNPILANNLANATTKNFVKYSDNEVKTNFSNYSMKSNYKKFDLEPENLALDKLKDLWIFVLESFHKSTNNINFFLLYLIIFGMAFLFWSLSSRLSLLKKFLGGPARALIFSFFILSYIFAKPIFKPHKFYFGLAIILFLISFYYIFSAKSESAKDKLKSLLGFILASMVIPLILKAFLKLNNLD